MLNKTRFGILMQATAAGSAHRAPGGIPSTATIAVPSHFGDALGHRRPAGAPIFLAEPTWAEALASRVLSSASSRLAICRGRRDRRTVSRLIETFGARYISSNFRDAYAFIVMRSPFSSPGRAACRREEQREGLR